ncbi:MAG: hypothetical protein AAF629_02970 [Chloroflexota bacterium]
MSKTPVLVTLLGLFLCAFIGLRPFVTTVLQAQDVSIMGFSVFDTGLQVFLALGIVFLEFAIIFFSLLDRIGDTIKSVLKPLASLIPLGMFVSYIQKTFTPIFLSMFPQRTALQIGDAQITAESSMPVNESYITAAINSGDFTYNVLLTVAFMGLFALISSAVSQPKDFASELRRLRAENARFKKLLQ